MTFKHISEALQHTVWVAQVIILLVGSVMAMQLMDREAPFTVEEHTPFVVKAGEWAHLAVPVKRDLTRNCSVTFSRYIFDSRGHRFDLVAQAEASDEFIRDMDRRTPNKLLIGMLIPPAAVNGSGGISEGPARLVTNLSYRCYAANVLLPITTTSTVHLDVVH